MSYPDGQITRYKHVTRKKTALKRLDAKTFRTPIISALKRLSIKAMAIKRWRASFSVECRRPVKTCAHGCWKAALKLGTQHSVSMTCCFHEMLFPWHAVSMKCCFHEMLFPWHAVSKKCCFHEMLFSWHAVSSKRHTFFNTFFLKLIMEIYYFTVFVFSNCFYLESCWDRLNFNKIP